MIARSTRTPIQRTAVELAVSGGGYRAAAFGLGAALCLSDYGLLSRVVSVSSVSGGSFLNGHLEGCGILQSPTQPESRDRLLRFGAILARRSAFWPEKRAAIAYLPPALVLVMGAVVATALVAIWQPLYIVLSFVILMIVVYIAFAMRGSVLLRTLNMTFASQAPPDGPHATHVYCTSELRSGRPLYFVGSTEVFSSHWGWGHHNLNPGLRVLASAAFPGLCHPLLLRATALGLGQNLKGRLTLALCDGGVTNNLGTEWYEAEPDRMSLGDRYVQQSVAVLRVAIDASAPPMRDARIGRFRTPLSEIGLFFRQVSVLYENTLRPRVLEIHRTALDRREIGFVIASLTSDASEQAGMTDAISRTNANARIRARLVAMREELQQSALTAVSTSTTLRRLGDEVTSRIVQHGYVVTLAATAGRVNLRQDIPVPTVDQLKAELHRVAADL